MQRLNSFVITIYNIQYTIYNYTENIQNTEETNSRDKKDVDDGEINKLDFFAASPTDLQATASSAVAANTIPDNAIPLSNFCVVVVL